MSKLCPLDGCKKNCTDNCNSCMSDDKRYSVKAYLSRNFVGLMEELYTDDWSEVEKFIWEHCQKGLNCKFVDRASSAYEGGEAFADLFNENTVEVEELIVRYSFM